MRQMLFVLALATGIVACQKSLSKEQEFITKDFFYRISAYDGGGNLVDYSYIVTTKVDVGAITGEFRGQSNTDDVHYDGDKCDEKSAKFCEKHPWHKKCPQNILGLRMDQLVAQKNTDHITISWRMVDEGSIAEFSVDRSENAKTFTSVRRLKSKGNNALYTVKDYNK